MQHAPRHPPTAEQLADRLEAAGLRPTSKRIALGKLIFGDGDRHFTAEALWKEAQDADVRVSLATIYNTLNALVDADLLRTVEMTGAKALFDTNLDPHHHVLDGGGDVCDLPFGAVTVHVDEAALPPGMSIDDIELLVRVKRRS